MPLAVLLTYLDSPVDLCMFLSVLTYVHEFLHDIFAHKDLCILICRRVKFVKARAIPKVTK